MASGVDMALSDLADWWDGQKRQSEKILTDWVQDNPQWWAIGIAGTLQTSMDLGSGMVDVLRLGQGAAQGGWKGYGKDALRLLTLLGPITRAGGALHKALTPLAASGRLRLAVPIGQVDGPCTFQAVNNALAISGGKNAFIIIDDMAAAMGRQLSQLGRNPSGKYQLSAWIDELIPFLRQIGSKVKEVRGLSTVREVEMLASRESSPVIFAIKTTVKGAGGKVTEIYHSVIAMRSSSGVRFADYGGKFYASLDDLVNGLGYGSRTAPIALLQSGVSAAIVNGATLTGEYASKLAQGAVVVLEGLSLIETTQGETKLAAPVAPVATTLPATDDVSDAEVIKGSLEAYKARIAGKPVIRLPPIYITAGKRDAPPSQQLDGVQFRLNALGFGAGRVDGIYGPRTKKAVRLFQQSYPPLASDSIPGPKTQARLVEICGY